MITLTDSRVSFDKETHTYLRDGVILDGITGRIRERLFPDEYANVSEEVLAAAAERGTLIHEAIQRCDEEGYSPTVEELCDEPLLACVDRYSDIMAENGLTSVANEYLVTDGHTYASAIDIVAENDGYVILVDTKTTYTVNRDYVSWQLSVYADFFEAQNPHLKVLGLACLWFKVRHGVIEGAELISIPRRDSELVQRMLYTDEPIYTGLEPMDAELVRLISEKNALETQIDALKEQMMAAMEKGGLTSWKSGDASYTYRKGGTSNRFDSAAFKKAEPALYKQYTKPCESKACLTVKLAVDAV